MNEVGGGAFEPGRKLVLGLVRLCLLMLLLVTGIALAARLHWLAELFTHFRPWYLAVGAVLVILTLIARQRLLTVLAAATLFVNGLYVFPWLSLAGADVYADTGPAARQVMLTALNLNFRNQSHDAMVEFLLGTEADVLIIEELTESWIQGLAPLNPRYEHRFNDPREGAFGMGLWSRFPMSGLEVTGLGVPGSVNMRAEVAGPAGNFVLWAVHLQPPTAAHRAEARNRQLSILAEEVAGDIQAGHTVLVIGDLNCTPFSPYFREFLDVSGLNLPGDFDVTAPTWPARRLPGLVAIDHVLVGPGTPRMSVNLGPAVGSDHFPVVARMDVAP